MGCNCQKTDTVTLKRHPAAPLEVMKDQQAWSLAAMKAKIHLVWARMRWPLYRTLYREVVREICRYLGIEEMYLVCIQGSTIRFFDAEMSTWKTPIVLSPAVLCDSFSSYSFIRSEAGSHDICICGGNGSDTAFVVRLRTHQHFVEALSHMNKARDLPGLVHFEGSVFVFGGGCKCQTGSEIHLGPCSGYSAERSTRHAGEWYKSGEMLSLQTSRSWTFLRSEMHEARWGFTPCISFPFLYLCGGFPSISVEQFSLKSHSFMRVATLPEASPSVGWLSEGKLTVISMNFITWVEVSSGKCKEEMHAQMGIWPNSQPVVVGANTYWVAEGNCVRATLGSHPTFLKVVAS